MFLAIVLVGASAKPEGCKNFKVRPEAVHIVIHEGKRENRATAGRLAIES